MKKSRRDELNEEWIIFLGIPYDDIKITNHCLFRVGERFPELLETTKDDFLRMIKAGIPDFSYYSKKLKQHGVLAHNGKYGFAIDTRDGVILTIFLYRKKGFRKSSSGYNRHKFKQGLQKEISEEI
ncbi:MAG: hypothetical protein NTZ49_03060 [Candidatus Parcubacteria bacterium]|nr:hypothetical protein [Candidatus Parcubacteria bacterium]